MAEIVKDVLIALLGAIGGSLLTITIQAKVVNGKGKLIDQSKSTAGGDIIAGNKTTKK